jgi:hypothetical protein
MNMKEGRHLGDLDVNDRIMLKWFLRKYGLSMWTGLLWLRIL